jgi:hypothetical protein
MRGEVEVHCMAVWLGPRKRKSRSGSANTPLRSAAVFVEEGGE